MYCRWRRRKREFVISQHVVQKPVLVGIWFVKRIQRCTNHGTKHGQWTTRHLLNLTCNLLPFNIHYFTFPFHLFYRRLVVYFPSFPQAKRTAYHWRRFWCYFPQWSEFPYCRLAQWGVLSSRFCIRGRAEGFGTLSFVGNGWYFQVGAEALHPAVHHPFAGWGRWPGPPVSFRVCDHVPPLSDRLRVGTAVSTFPFVFPTCIHECSISLSSKNICFVWTSKQMMTVQTVYSYAQVMQYRWSIT